MGSALQLQVTSRIEELRGVADQAAAFLEAAGCNPSTLFAIQFALEELLSNIIHHSFAGDHEPHEIAVLLERDHSGFTLTIEDDGAAFDPLSAPSPDTTLPLEQRPIGGLGLFITQRLASGMDYRRTEGKNRVRVRFMQTPGNT